jgi:xanthine dehydrogenase small subunit
MIEFLLNNDSVRTGLPAGTTVLDFVRYDQNLKGTKIGCREGDCGACTVLVGELVGDAVKYRSMTSCLMPLANAAGKHIVTVEGINKPDGGLTGVQQAMVDENGTQCGFCTVGFVMSLTGFCVDDTAKTCASAVSAVDGNICRCTGYKSIERAAERLADLMSVPTAAAGDVDNTGGNAGSLERANTLGIIPGYFSGIKDRLQNLQTPHRKSQIDNRKFFVGGGTDLYVQRHDEMTHAPAENLLYNDELRGISDKGEFIEIGASATVTDLLVSPVMQEIFPHLYSHLKLISSTPIRNMATLAGNFVNASPIGDMTAWFLALDASITFDTGRELPLRELYLGYKTLAKTDDEFIKTIRFQKPVGDFRFNFEKVSKRTYLDIASVNTAISMVLSAPSNGDRSGFILEAHASAGGVAPIPLYLKKTSEFLRGKQISEEVMTGAINVMQAEISPISDVRGSEEYKRLLLTQLFKAHFVELFDIS